MENYNSDNFERLLKETTDQFRMYPSRRVWHSLYNDLHPGKKWPSVAVLLLLITSIMYIGVTNSNDKVASSPNTPVLATNSGENKNEAITAVSPQLKSRSQINTNNYNTTSTTNISLKPTASSSPNGIWHSTSVVLENTNNSNQKRFQNASPVNSFSQPSNAIHSTQVKISVTTIENTLTAKTQPVQNEDRNDKSVPGIVPVSETILNSDLKKTSEVGTLPVNTSTTSLLNTSNITADDNAWIEDYVLHNKKKTRNFKHRFSYQIYVTPSIGYRTLAKNTNFSPPNVASLIASPGQSNSIDYTIDQASAVNLEAGSSVNLSITKRLRVKAGIQLNYTNYTINAYELNHPTFTTLMLNDPNNGYPGLSSRSTTIANTPGLTSKYLNNNTYQLSTPVGADFKLAGKNNLKWYTGATVQPTYVTGGHSYLISSDMKNYVNGKDLMRKFNVNGSFETFVSYRTKSGIILNAGPQFRYQFFSTYSQQYTYDEKLYNLGIKLGMTKNF